MHGGNWRSFSRFQFENWGVVAAPNRLVMHLDAYLYDKMQRKTNFLTYGFRKVKSLERIID